VIFKIPRRNWLGVLQGVFLHLDEENTFLLPESLSPDIRERIERLIARESYGREYLVEYYRDSRTFEIPEKNFLNILKDRILPNLESGDTIIVYTDRITPKVLQEVLNRRRPEILVNVEFLAQGATHG
jgi:hypothetical protein